MTEAARREAERIAAWAERQAASESAPVPVVRPQGSAAHLTDVERRDIWDAYLTQQLARGPRPTFVSLAKQFNRNRDTISAVLKGEAFEAYKRERFAEVRNAALDAMQALVPEAVEAFRTAIPIAAEKGDVRAAERALLYTGTVAPIGSDDAESGFKVIVGAGGMVNIGQAIQVKLQEDPSVAGDVRVRDGVCDGA